MSDDWRKQSVEYNNDELVKPVGRTRRKPVWDWAGRDWWIWAVFGRQVPGYDSGLTRLPVLLLTQWWRASAAGNRRYVTQSSVYTDVYMNGSIYVYQTQPNACK